MACGKPGAQNQTRTPGRPWVVEGGMVGRFAHASRETCWFFKRCMHRPAGVRAPIVAWKPGNAGGAKGCRKMETTALGFQNSTTAECRKARLGREPLDAVGSTTGNSVCRGCGRRLV